MFASVLHRPLSAVLRHLLTVAQHYEPMPYHPSTTAWRDVLSAVRTGQWHP